MKTKNYLIVLATVVMSIGSVYAATVNINVDSKNNTAAKALNLDKYFDKSFDVNIGKSTSVAHATAVVTTTAGSSYDWFSFRTTQKNLGITIDIDATRGGLNTWVTLENSKGVTLANNNNSLLAKPDKGSASLLDSYLTFVLQNTGLYKIRVSQVNNRGNLAGLVSGQNYRLNLSLNNSVSEVPIPAAAWLFGSGMAGLMRFRKKIASIG